VRYLAVRYALAMQNQAAAAGEKKV